MYQTYMYQNGVVQAWSLVTGGDAILPSPSSGGK